MKTGANMSSNTATRNMHISETILDLYAANTLDAFWQLLVEPAVTPAEWAEATEATSSLLPVGDRVAAANPHPWAAALAEVHCGPARWRLGRAVRLYYRWKPLVPHQLALTLRRYYRRQQEISFPLAWPVEDRYVRFLYGCVAHVLRQRGLDCAPFVSLWPDGRRFSLVLTHDVERGRGHAFVKSVADLEERLGFRSAFNFVPERYPVDQGLLADLRQRGFEIGVHGLKHDGMLFNSRRTFEQRAIRINRYLRAWGAVGFRAPYTHRHPEWMQALDIAYDASFFDTDPYETMPGGTMSIWPFFLGHFVELPYTLVQDHTLMVILGEGTPRLWLDKVNFIEQWQGMALVNTHPDYLREQRHLAIYEAFLASVKERQGYWHALPHDVASWWRSRAGFRPQQHDGQWDLSGLPGGTISYVAQLCPSPNTFS